MASNFSGLFYWATPVHPRRNDGGNLRPVALRWRDGEQHTSTQGLLVLVQQKFFKESAWSHCIKILKHTNLCLFGCFILPETIQQFALPRGTSSNHWFSGAAYDSGCKCGLRVLYKFFLCVHVPLCSPVLAEKKCCEYHVNAFLGGICCQMKNLPSRELTYPQKMGFWRLFSFSQGGIC